MNVCAPAPNSYVEVVIPNVMAFGGYQGLRVEPRRIGLVPVKEETRDMSSLPAMYGYNANQEQASSDIKSADPLMWDFPASRTGRNKLLLFNPVCGILLQQPELTHLPKVTE